MIDEIEKKIRSLIQGSPKLPVSVFSNPCWAGLEAMEWEEVGTLTRGHVEGDSQRLENAPERVEQAPLREQDPYERARKDRVFLDTFLEQTSKESWEVCQRNPWPALAGS